MKNDGFDNEDSDYILYVNDILGSEETGHKYISTCNKVEAFGTNDLFLGIVTLFSTFSAKERLVRWSNVRI